MLLRLETVRYVFVNFIGVFNAFTYAFISVVHIKYIKCIYHNVDVDIYNVEAFLCSQNKRTPLHMAAEKGRLECIAKLLALNADPNFNDAVRVLQSYFNRQILRIDVMRLPLS